MRSWTHGHRGQRLSFALMVALALLAPNGVMASTAPPTDALDPRDTEVVVAGPDEPGQPLRISGHVLDAVTGEPVPEARIIVYQTDSTGDYAPADPSDESTARLRGELVTDGQGSFAFRTIVPGEYPDQPTGNRHIHVHSVSAPGYAPTGFVILFDDNVRDEVRDWAEGTGFGYIIETTQVGEVTSGWLDIELEPMPADQSPAP